MRHLSQSRRILLAAVVFVDVVGYTRMMERDEQGTHERWMTLRSNEVAPVVRTVFPLR